MSHRPPQTHPLPPFYRGVTNVSSCLLPHFVTAVQYGGNTNRNLDGSCTIDLCVM